MKPAPLTLLIIALVGCRQIPEKDKQGTTQNRTWQSGKVWVEDSSLYSPTFLKLLAKADYPDSIRLIGPSIIVSGDTTLFPMFPATGDSANFNNAGFRLKISRINYSTIYYSAQWKGPVNNWESQSGEAVLNPFFFLAAEVVDDPETGVTVGMAEFISDDNEYSATILLSLDTVATGKLLSTFSMIKKSQVPAAPVSSPMLKQN